MVDPLPGYAFGILQVGVVQVAAGPGDQGAADAMARGSLRSSHADREQAVGVLKTAFVQGRLTRDELDQRVGLALAARTCAELAALTADVPAGLTAAQPLQPARAQGEQAVLRGPGRVLVLATVVYAAVWPVALAIAGVVMLDSRQQKRSGRQLPPGQAPGAGGLASLTPPSTSPGEQLAPGNQGRSHTATAARRRRPEPVLPGPRSLRQWHPRVLPATTAGDRLP
jgi:hypothetical protein